MKLEKLQMADFTLTADCSLHLCKSNGIFCLILCDIILAEFRVPAWFQYSNRCHVGPVSIIKTLLHQTA